MEKILILNILNLHLDQYSAQTKKNDNFFIPIPRADSVLSLQDSNLELEFDVKPISADARNARAAIRKVATSSQITF